MNSYIELVKKWLADNDSVRLEELRANKDDARDAYLANDWANDRANDWADGAAYWTYRAAYLAAYWFDDLADDADNNDYVEYCKQKAIEAVAKYEELTK
jgi:hypothetical protein